MIWELCDCWDMEKNDEFLEYSFCGESSRFGLVLLVLRHDLR